MSVYIIQLENLKNAIDIIKKLETLSEEVTFISRSKVSPEHKDRVYHKIMTDAKQLVADYLDVTGEALPKSNGDNIIHYAGTIEKFGGDIGRARKLKIPTDKKNELYKRIMKETIQFIANYLDSTGRQITTCK
jgi:hypothetical protein